MTIAVNGKLPAATVALIENGKVSNDVNLAEAFAGKKVALFGVPGAFTPTCSEKHLPGYIANADKLHAKGIDQIVCLSVNDPFVMKAWADAVGAGDKVSMAADGALSFTSAAGLELPIGGQLGTRCKRFSMVIDNGTVTALNVEDGGDFKVSSAEHLLENL